MARRLVVLSAGTIGSPAILERSGIGSKEVLEKAGVKHMVDLPGVGENHIGLSLMTYNAKWKPQVDAFRASDPP